MEGVGGRGMELSEYGMEMRTALTVSTAEWRRDGNGF